MSKKRVSVAGFGLLVVAACSAPEPAYQAVVIAVAGAYPELILVDTQTGEAWRQTLGAGYTGIWDYLEAPTRPEADQ